MHRHAWLTLPMLLVLLLGGCEFRPLPAEQGSELLPPPSPPPLPPPRVPDLSQAPDIVAAPAPAGLSATEIPAVLGPAPACPAGTALVARERAVDCVRDADGERHGPGLRWSEDGSFLQRVEHRDGEPSGTWTQIDAEGRRLEELVHLEEPDSDGEIETIERRYHPNGQLAFESKPGDGEDGEGSGFRSWYADGQLEEDSNGPYDDWQSYWPDGSTKCVKEVLGSEGDGTITCHDEQGRVESECDYFDHGGRCTEYAYGEEAIERASDGFACPAGTAARAVKEDDRDDGGTEIGCYLPDGEQHGPSESRGDGRVERVTWERGEPHGHWTGHRSGALVAEGHYERGERVGEWLTYYERPRGARESLTTWVDGERHGPERAWYKDGQLEEEREFERGMPRGHWKHHAADGALVWDVDFGTDGSARFVQKDGKGRVRVEGRVVEGVQQGTWTYYFHDGEIEAEGKFVDGEASGRWVLRERGYGSRGWFEVAEGEFDAGETSGDWTFYTQQPGESRAEAIEDAEVCDPSIEDDRYDPLGMLDEECDDVRPPPRPW